MVELEGTKAATKAVENTVQSTNSTEAGDDDRSLSVIREILSTRTKLGAGDDKQVEAAAEEKEEEVLIASGHHHHDDGSAAIFATVTKDDSDADLLRELTEKGMMDPNARKKGIETTQQAAQEQDVTIENTTSTTSGGSTGIRPENHHQANYDNSEFMMHESVPQLPLYRTHGGVHAIIGVSQQPGAYAGGLGGRMDRVNNLDLSLVGNQPAAAAAAPNGSNESATQDLVVTEGDDGHLPQATKVDDENPDDQDLPQAQEYNPTTASRDHNKKARQRNLAVGIFIVFAMLALLLGIYFGVKNNSKSSDNEIEIEDNQMAPTTPSPSVSPSEAPSAIMDDLLEILPHHTLASLLNYSSPQFQAWQWVENHHNITGMPTWRKEQLFAMATFFYSMNGPNWRDYAKERWMVDTVSECLWFSTVAGHFRPDGTWSSDTWDTSVGFEQVDSIASGQPTNCDVHGRLNTIALRMALNTVVPSQVPSLAGGQVPPEIGLLSSLVLLDLSLNFIGGSAESLFPKELFLLTNLGQIDVRYSAITGGSLPTFVGSLVNLETLTVAYNGITGTIPSEVGKLTGLKDLYITGTQMRGALPTEMGALRKLTSLLSEQNDLSGSLPTELGQCEDLKELYLSNCPFLSGPIPSEFGKLTRMERFYLPDPLLTGTIPTELGLMTACQSLVLSHNSFSGTIPSELGTIEAMKYLILFGNNLTGRVPSEILHFEHLFTLNLGSNQLSGPIPAEIGPLPSLRIVNLEENRLSAHIPSEIGLLTAVTQLYLSDNPFLTGPLPTETGLMTDLMELNLANTTGLTGNLPSELGALVSAFNLSVVNVMGASNLTGEIPKSICFMQNPNCTYKPYSWSDPTPCSLEFDCISDSSLCGCDCSCASGQ